MPISIMTCENEGTMKVSGRIDATNASEFEKALMPLLEKATNPVLDFSEVPYISSMGLRVLIQAARLLKEKKGTLTIQGASSEVFLVLKISGFCDFINIQRQQQ